jgi:aspartate oxidase
MLPTTCRLHPPNDRPDNHGVLAREPVRGPSAEIYIDRVPRLLLERTLDDELLPRDTTRRAIELRRPTAADLDVLADLMLDAYLDTIDYEGETIVEAREEVAQWLANPNTRFEWSLIALDADHARGALLAGESQATPFVYFIMVRRAGAP